MNKTLKNILLWIGAVIITLATVAYQRATGPTYPVKGKVEIGSNIIDYTLIRTFGGDQDALVKIDIPDKEITGSITLKRYLSNDEWGTFPMKMEEMQLVGTIPNQPPAGKVEYYITLHSNDEDYELGTEAAIIRFKGKVPLGVLIPHIIMMFIALLVSIRVGFELLFGGNGTKLLTTIVIVAMFIGGLIFGPIVQKYAFGAFWTGWPIGHDLTDNKTIFVFIFWLIAFFVLRKRPQNKLWPSIAMIFMLTVYAIPHSAMGSEIDHTKTENTEINK